MPKIIRTVCRICYNSCGVLIHMKDGMPYKIEGDPDNPISKGVLCHKGAASLEYLNSPHRLKYPMKRKGPRGGGQWERINWDTALSLVSENMNTIKQKYSPLSMVFIRGASKGVSDACLAKLANIYGSPNITSPAPYCFVPGMNASKITYGYYPYADYSFPPKVIVAWAVNPEATNPSDFEDIKQAKEKGSLIIVVDPLSNQLTRIADLWVRIRPGTDLALVLGMINYIIKERLYDEGFVKDWTIGFNELSSHVEEYTLERVEKITWVPEDTIKRFARTYSQNLPGFISLGNGVETNINSFQTCRGISILRSLVGNLSIPGGEVRYTTPGNIESLDDYKDRIPAETRDRRLSSIDGLMPIIYYTLFQRIIKAINENDPYPVKGLYIQASNVLTSWTNSKETYKAINKLDFIAVADQFMTPTAALADVVLPSAMYMEYDSVEKPWHAPIALAQVGITTCGESWPDCKIINELLKKMGYKKEAYEDLSFLLEDLLKPSGVILEEFKRIGYFVGKQTYRHYLNGGFETETGKVELYSKKLDEWGYDPLPRYKDHYSLPGNDDSMEKEYPLIFTTRKSPLFRHSGGRQIEYLRNLKNEPILWIHPDTAGKLGIIQGDTVYIETSRGKIEQKAGYNDLLDPRVVEVDYAWWYPERLNERTWETANVNVLTDNNFIMNPEMGSPNMRGIRCRVTKK